jgi:DNA primase
MSNWIDFRELREQLDFGGILQHYGVELKIRGDQHHGFCPLPLHQGRKNSPSFSANLTRKIWQCFGCGRKGNVIDFAVLMEGLDPEMGEDVRKVAAELETRFVRVSEGRVSVTPPAEIEGRDVVINAPLDFELKGLDATHPYLFDRGFTEETIREFGLGYCGRGLLAGRIAIPLHDEKQTLVGYAGRVVDDDRISEDNPRYKFPGRRERKGVVHEFRKSLLLYNHNRIRGRVADVAVVEGFTSVWWLTQAGIRNVVGLMGSSCSESQATAIASILEPEGHAWVLADGDEAGARCAVEVFRQLGTTRFVRWIACSTNQQPTDLSPDQLRAVLPFAAR